LTGKLTVLPLRDLQAVVLPTVVNVAVIDQKALTLNRLLLLVHQFNVLTVENEFNGLLDLLIVLGLEHKETVGFYLSSSEVLFQELFIVSDALMVLSAYQVP
jgi:hypothetical protein